MYNEENIDGDFHDTSVNFIDDDCSDTSSNFFDENGESNPRLNDIFSQLESEIEADSTSSDSEDEDLKFGFDFSFASPMENIKHLVKENSNLDEQLSADLDEQLSADFTSVSLFFFFF